MPNPDRNTRPTNEGRNELRAGVAEVDITPPLGAHLAGDVGKRRPAEAVGDPLRAKALILENGQCKICFLALDVTIITRQYTQRIRQAVGERCGLAPDAVMVHTTQTHSAPSIGHFMIDDDFPSLPADLEWLRGGEEAYCDFAVAGAIEAVVQANASLEPVEVGAASGIEGRMAYNRRAVGRDGLVSMPYRWTNPLGPAHIRYMEGPMDPELGVLGVRTLDGRMLSLLLNYTCHPVHVFPQLVVSADWPGVWSQVLHEALGAQCVPVVLNGACGNINPWPPFDPDYQFNGDHQQMGSVLAATSRKVIETLEFRPEATLAYATKHIKLPYRVIESEQLAGARRYLEANPVPVWSDDDPQRVSPEWTHAAWLLSKHLEAQREGALDYEIQVLRVGEAAFVGLPGEPFVEGGLRIKMESPTYPTYIVHCTTQYVAYLPTKDAVPRGGHEVHFSKCIPEALDMVVDGAVELLQAVYSDSA